MRRLLVVDDEPDMLDFVERVFRREYQVERALSVEDAIALLAKGSFDVLITDQRMPKRSGGELLAHAAQLQPGAVRVLLSGYSEPDETMAAADAHVLKPVDADALRQAVADALLRREAAAR